MENLHNPKVSVCVITYNQEKYIRQCLQSLIDQETDFDFEIIVGDDHSGDGTRIILLEYLEKYPQIVKINIQVANTGGSKNYIDTHALARGKYVAHLDGDDYALPGKLQALADFLDNNSKYNIVWHRMYYLNDISGVMAEDLIQIDKLPKGGCGRIDLLRFGTIGMHGSMMYRRPARDFDLPEFPVLDFFAQVERIGSGVAGFVGSYPFGVYRVGNTPNDPRDNFQKSLLYFTKKYPEYKREISTAAFVSFISSVKNMAWRTCLLFLKVLWTTFRLSTLFDFWRYRHVYAMLRPPREVQYPKR
ncbi:MAG: glycosyltransferase family 2 protein [Holophagaceae bacterium]|nr:glycosyltransferase family 2 protein [Holophagaceae bacterium]